MTREEAIKWVDDRMCWGRGTFTKNHPPNIDECWEAGCMAIKALKSDRPTGEWIYAKEQLEIVPMWECSCCRMRMQKKFNFCPNCGADMRGEQDG